MEHQRTPEECLAMYARHINEKFSSGQTELETYLGRSVEGTDLGELSLELTGASNHATAIAISGLRHEAEHLLGWVRRAAQRIVIEGDGWDRYWAYDALIAAEWLLTAEFDPSLAKKAATAYLPDAAPETRIAQALRLIEGNEHETANEFIQRLPRVAGPGRTLTPTTAICTVVDHFRGNALPDGFNRLLVTLIARLRCELFASGLFLDILPWLRLYNWLTVKEADPWKVVGWLRGDPMKTLP